MAKEKKKMFEKLKQKKFFFNIERTHTTQHQKKQTTQLKNGQRIQIGISPKKTYTWPTGHEKMLNITNHQGNANQNHNEILPHICQNGCYQKDNKQQVLVRLWKKGNPHALLVGM